MSGKLTTTAAAANNSAAPPTIDHMFIPDGLLSLLSND
jgi:hypothetical protein